MIGMVSWKVVHSCAAKRYGVARRSFFVPGTGCQALVLECQAPVLEKLLRVLGCGLGVLTPNSELRTPNPMRRSG